MPDSYCQILTAAGSRGEADRLAELLVSRRLAACVQVAAISSCYRWKGEVKKDPEYLLLIKTAAHLYEEVEAAILEDHSYELPEVIQLPIARGLDRYLGWIEENVGPPERPAGRDPEGRSE
jgi:periplasmic divalent cation tolerance protein